MSRFVPLDTTLVRTLIADNAPLQAYSGAELSDPGMIETVARDGWAMLDRGYVLGAGGLVPLWPGRALAWLIVGPGARPRHIVGAVGFARNWFAEREAAGKLARIEATAVGSHPQGCRFLERLGFAREGLLRRYGPDGADHILYARVRP